jgi:hypothetical protein
MDNEISFGGFGKIASSSPGPSGGYGTSGSFVPSSPDIARFPERNTRWEQLDFSWLGYSWDNGNQGNDIYIGQNVDAPAWVREVTSVSIQNVLYIEDGTSTTAGAIELNANGVDTGSPFITITDTASGNKVAIGMPQDAGNNIIGATWKEIDICVDGNPKKMKVLGTDPYSV